MQAFRLFGLVAVASELVVSAARAAVSEPPPPIHLGIALGAGTAYDGLGVHVELRGTHFGVYLGTGALGFLANSGVPDTSSLGGCAGLRWFLGDGDRLFVSLNSTLAAFSYHYDPSTRQSSVVSGNLATVTGTVGGRWRWGRTFAEASLGGGIAYLSDPGEGSTNSPPPGQQNRISWRAIPDLSLGVGVEF